MATSKGKKTAANVISPNRINGTAAATQWPGTVSGVNTTATQTGNASVTPQTGGTGNANINPYHNAYEAYQTSMGKVKDAQTGQANTEYNQQQQQIAGQYNNMGRNAYVTYMQRIRQNQNAASNMGANRTGMAENMQTANMADYNRSVGNAGAYRQAQLSNAENAYNSKLAGIETDYAKDLANAENEYAQAEIARNNELSDLQTNLDFQAQQNALDREQSAFEADRAYKQQVQAQRDKRYETRFNSWVETIGRFDSVKSVDKAIKKLKDQKKSGKLTGWRKEYYSDMMSYLRAQRTAAKKNKK
jgi:ribosomal protein S21